MAGKLGKYQMVGPHYWNGLTRDNYFGTLALSKPNMATDFMVQLMALHRGPTLESALSKYSTKEFDSTEEYTWSVTGSARRNIPLIEARDETGKVITVADASRMIGANKARFQLVFGENYFFFRDTIVGNLNEVYPFIVLNDAINEGSNCVYNVELSGGNTEGIPASRLLPGEKFSIEAPYAEMEMSREQSGIHFAAPVSMRNEFSFIRKKHKVAGITDLNRQLACGLPVVDQAGKKHVETIWMHYVDWTFEQEFSDNKNNALMFGRSNRNKNGEYMDIGPSGGIVKQGAGLREQCSVANQFYYNHFSLKLIEEALYGWAYGKVGMGDRVFELHTGEAGAAQFSKAVADETSGWTPFQVNADALGIIKPTTNAVHGTALSAGYQFTEFRAPNGVVLRVVVDAYYDDAVRNKIMWKGYPAESFRYDIFDMGTMDQPNIFKCTVKGKSEFRGYQWGPFANPFTGETNNSSASYDEDSAVMHKSAVLGVCVLDPTRTMSFIPSVLDE